MLIMFFHWQENSVNISNSLFLLEVQHLFYSYPQQQG